MKRQLPVVGMFQLLADSPGKMGIGRRNDQASGCDSIAMIRESGCSFFSFSSVFLTMPISCCPACWTNSGLLEFSLQFIGVVFVLLVCLVSAGSQP